MAEPRKCPFFSGSRELLEDCLEFKCALWNYRECSFLSVAKHLNTIEDMTCHLANQT